ncbi:MAG TPA: LacI family DNA-binding transcriptional regulator [Rectinemataceae bacterium]|nr:LacI family DNA-binding transcriptional regulator [Rectinemataceae bacterium]
MSKQKATTIQDVANKAKVSISTVSHVLNKTRHVEKTRHDRVVAAVKELGYRPNQLARGLRGAGSKTIGLIISDIREEFFAGLTKAVESAANERGYLVTLCDSEEDPEKEARYIEILADRGVDGIILAPVDRNVTVRVPRGGNLPVVLVDRRSEESGLDFVGIENGRSAREATRHLVGLGRKKLGFIGHEMAIATMGERAEGFVAAMEELGLADEARVLTLRSRAGDNKAKVKRWLAKSPDLDGIICGNANLCYLTLSVLEESGVEVPGKMAVVSFDDPECFRFMRSPITAIRQPTERIGATAFDVLLAKVEGRATTGTGASNLDAPEASEYIIPARLIVRESCGTPRHGGPNA